MAKSDDLRKIDENDIRSNFEDERTQARIQEHLNNEHDIITEEDIANIQIGAVPSSGIGEDAIGNDSLENLAESERQDAGENLDD